MRSRITWIGIVVGLLGMSVVTYGVLIVVAINDPSFALEPDYERRAAEWDDVQQQAAANRRLGWTVDLSTTPAETAGVVDVALLVHDPEGDLVRGASAAVETFHNARASKIIDGRLDEDPSGVYRAQLPMQRSGVWEFRIEIDRDADHFTAVVRKSVISPPRRGGER